MGCSKAEASSLLYGGKQNPVTAEPRIAYSQGELNASDAGQWRQTVTNQLPIPKPKRAIVDQYVVLRLCGPVGFEARPKGRRS